MIKNEISIPQLQGFDGTLEELSRIINFLKEDYGGDSRVWFDADRWQSVEVIIGIK
jgi:hypothetical protein